MLHRNQQDSPSFFYLSGIWQSTDGQDIRNQLQCFHLVAFCAFPENVVKQNVSWKT